MPSGVKTSEKTIRKIKKMALAGVKHKEISRATGVNISTISRMLTKMQLGVSQNSLTPFDLAEWDEVTARLRRLMKS